MDSPLGISTGPLIVVNGPRTRCVSTLCSARIFVLDEWADKIVISVAIPGFLGVRFTMRTCGNNQSFFECFRRHGKTLRETLEFMCLYAATTSSGIELMIDCVGKRQVVLSVVMTLAGARSTLTQQLELAKTRPFEPCQAEQKVLERLQMTHMSRDLPSIYAFLRLVDTYEVAGVAPATV